ncbi:MAG: phosphatidate cytidylyltransferase, partial [Candidatus Bruticola sp.]
NVYFWLIMGIGCCLLGQLGDLFESSLKRDANCKDSGAIIPGHGGLLDRFDSYLFASLFAYMWLTICLSLPFLDTFFSI